MKYFFTIALILSINITVFPQTAVSVPDNFIGTWWIDISEESNAPGGVQILMSIEIRGDGTWISSCKFVAYNQIGLQMLTEAEIVNNQVMIIESGYVIGATVVQIVIAKVGETQALDRFTVDGNDIVDIQRRRLTRDEPQAQGK